MKIEIIDTFEVLCATENRDALWKERVVTPLLPMTEIMHMDFTAMGACGLEENLSDECRKSIMELRAGKVEQRVKDALDKSVQAFKEHGFTRFPDTLRVGLFVSNGKNPIHNDLNMGFTGFGGIPGFIILILSPTEYVLKSLEALVAHEFHHNIRFLIEPWPKDMQISVGKYLLDEGLAEAFAAELYGEKYIGPQTTGLSAEALAAAQKIVFPHIREKDFQKARSLLFGDPMADTFGYPKSGLPHGAGYAVGYRWVKDYFAKTGKNIFTATQETSEEILNEIFELKDKIK